jgi:hypothetical protein
MSSPVARSTGVEGVIPNVTVVSEASPVVLVKYEDLVENK